MTPAQREQLNRFLAETVLKTTLKYLARVTMFGDIPFNPIESWQDCEPLLDQIERDGWVWTWVYSAPNEYSFALQKVDDGAGAVGAKEYSSRTEALCLAIARAYVVE